MKKRKIKTISPLAAILCLSVLLLLGGWTIIFIVDSGMNAFLAIVPIICSLLIWPAFSGLFSHVSRLRGNMAFDNDNDHDDVLPNNNQGIRSFSLASILCLITFFVLLLLAVMLGLFQVDVIVNINIITAVSFSLMWLALYGLFVQIYRINKDL